MVNNVQKAIPLFITDQKILSLRFQFTVQRNIKNIDGKPIHRYKKTNLQPLIASRPVATDNKPTEILAQTRAE